MTATRVTVDEVRERMDSGEPFVFVDARDPRSWREAQVKLPGAIHVTADEVDLHLDKIPRGTAVITYCTSPSEASSARLAHELSRRGRKNVYLLQGGFVAWLEADLPLEVKEAVVEDVDIKLGS